MVKGIIVILLIGFFGSTNVQAQCCSANPVAGSVNIGILTHKTFRAINYYRFFHANHFFTGSKPADFDGVDYLSYNFLGGIYAYGLTQKMTLETELGYYLNKSEKLNVKPAYIVKGSGLYNGVFSLKYNLFQKNNIELTASGGLKFPFSRTKQQVKGVVLPQTVQPSSGAFGGVAQLFLSKTNLDKGLRLFLIHRAEFNGQNPDEYAYGNIYSTSFFVSKSLNYRWTGIFQLNNEIRQRDSRSDQIIDSSGGYVLFASPQINYNIAQKWNVSLSFSLPL